MSNVLAAALIETNDAPAGRNTPYRLAVGTASTERCPGATATGWPST